MISRISQSGTDRRLHDFDISEINPKDVAPEQLDRIFRVCNGLWFHSGNPKDPHVELAGGLCSDGFVNMRPVLMIPPLCEIMAKCLVYGARHKHPSLPWENISWVIGSDHTSATLSYEVAKLLGAKHDFTERGPDKTQLWRRWTISPDEIVLQVESFIATGTTVKAVRQGLRTGNRHPINFFPAVLALAHRSGFWRIDSIYPVYALRHYEIKTWKREECPLHQQGSVSLVEPQYDWHRLTNTH